MCATNKAPMSFGTMLKMGVGLPKSAYSYDSLNPLKTVTDHNGQITSYGYDVVGNRTYETVNGVQTQYTYDNNDRLTQQGGTSYTYDNNGNTLTETLDGNTTTFIVDQNRDHAQVLLESDGANETLYSYGDDLLSQTRGGATSTYHYDGLGSTRALTDNAGTITDSYDYEAFGELLNHTGSTENNYLFTGEQYDPSLNQYYLRARYYNQQNGRFTQQDTWMGINSDPITLHKYLYTGADPVNRTDPSGNFFGSFSAAASIQGVLLRAAAFGSSFVITLGVGDGVVNNGVFHSYTTESTICQRFSVVNDPCTFENVFYGLRLFPAPGALGLYPINNGDYAHVTVLGDVIHNVTSDMVRNSTLPGHWLHPGFVERTVKQHGSEYIIETYGEGTGRFPLLNTFFSDVLWTSWDRNITGYVDGLR